MSIKLPRWEFELFRILKDKVGAAVYRRNDEEGRTHILVRPAKGLENRTEVCVLCLGPFQYYANSTKRTAASELAEHTLRLRGKQVMPVPFFIWNELKTDQDKLMYLFSKGREVAGGHPMSSDPPPISHINSIV